MTARTIKHDRYQSILNAETEILQHKVKPYVALPEKDARRT
jgi:hypothetical protein